MTENVKDISILTGVSRLKGRAFDVKVIHPADLETYVGQGWELYKKLSKTVQVKKNKLHSLLLEDRVWNMFFKMGFGQLSGQGGAQLVINPKEKTSHRSQIDIVAIDREVAIAIECKSSIDYKKRLQFQEELEKFAQIKDPFIKAIRSNFSNDGVKKQPVFIMFLSKAILMAMIKKGPNNPTLSCSMIWT